MRELALTLLGTCRVRLDDQAASGLYAHTEALLAYLALEAQRGHAREALAALLWSDDEPATARQNLRQALSRLRASLGDRDSDRPFLEVDRSRVGLNPSALIHCDVTAFERACRAGGTSDAGAERIQHLEEAVALYQGEFLAGFTAPASAAFDEWLHATRARLHRDAVTAFEALAQHYLDGGRSDAAVEIARRLVEIEPADELAHRILIRLLAQAGQLAAAEAHYRGMSEFLREHLDVEPSPETQAVLQWLREQRGGDAAERRRQRRQERRHVTLLHCGPRVEEHGGTVDPEELARWRDVLHGHLQQVAAAQELSFRTLDGLDAVLCFGLPQALPDGAERAAATALALRDWARQALAGHGIGLGIGVASGHVALLAEPGTGLFGTVSPLAARLRHLAADGEILLAASTQGLIQRSYRTAPAPRHDAHRLLEARRDGGEGPVLPLIGREHELAVLQRAWEDVENSRGSAILISGDAGLGKSHLLRTACAQFRGARRRFLLRCHRETQATPLAPFLRMLSDYCGLRSGESLLRRRRKFIRAAGALGTTRAERRLLAGMLDVGSAGASAASANARQQTITLLLRMLRVLATEPVVLAIEDLQWLDPSSRELLGLLLPELPELSCLVLMTAQQPPEASSWPADSAPAELQLRALTRAQAEQLVSLATPQGLERDLVERLVDQAAGVPLYLQTLAETLPEQLGGILPASLEDSVLARLDALGAVAEVARRAAVAGDEFDKTLLAALCDLDGKDLARALEALERARIIEPIEAAESRYAFCHGILRQVAYGTLLREQRQALHARAATALQKALRAGEPVALEQLAQQQEAAGWVEDAVVQYYRAGQQAFRRTAIAECAAHLEHGLELLGDQPPSRERDALELRLRVALTMPLLLCVDTRERARRNYERTRELTAALSSGELLHEALRSLCAYLMSSAEFAACQPLAERLLELADRENSGYARADARVVLGTVLLMRGKLRAAAQVLEDGATLAAAEARDGAPYAMGLAAQAYCAALRGQTERAAALAAQALDAARALTQPIGFVWAANMAVVVLELLGQQDSALALSAEVLALCKARGIASWGAWAQMLKERLSGRASATQLKNVLALRRRLAGSGIRQPYTELVALECCLQLEQLVQARQVLEEARALGTDCAAELLTPEFRRVEGLLLLHEGNRAQARALLREGYQLAERHRAHALQLRMALAMAGLSEEPSRETWQLLRRAVSTMRSLAVETPDLAAARALLARARDPA